MKSRLRPQSVAVICSSTLIVALFTNATQADIFRYRDGRVVYGTVVAQDEKQIENLPTTIWTVQVESGSYIRILESELELNGHHAASKAEQEYIELMKTNPPKTDEEHCRQAGWCKLNALPDLAQAHYERALDINPDNRTARVEAGFKEDANGRWVRIEEVMGRQRGKVRYGNGWKFPEDVAIQEAEKKAAKELAPLKKTLNSLHQQASSRNAKRSNEALAQLRMVQDPREAAILAEYFLDHKYKAKKPELRLVYARILSRFPTAIPALTNASLNDPEIQVRRAALDALKQLNARGSVPTYISYLTNTDNEMINRAAEGLANFDPPEAVLPLIYALNTEHEVEEGGGNDNFSMQGGMTFGGKSKKVKRNFANEKVLEALTQVTGVNFDYDEARWLNWYASSKAKPVSDLRRDL